MRGAVSNPAEIGSLLIEYGTLAKLTGKREYYDKAKRAVVELYNRHSAIRPGWIRNQRGTGTWTDTTTGIMGGIDSYYEYLLKAAIFRQQPPRPRLAGLHILSPAFRSTETTQSRAIFYWAVHSA